MCISIIIYICKCNLYIIFTCGLTLPLPAVLPEPVLAYVPRARRLGALAHVRHVRVLITIIILCSSYYYHYHHC